MSYVVNKAAQKQDFLREGFKHSKYNELEVTKNLYKHMILMTVTVDFTDEDVWLYTHVYYASSHITYPLNCNYGIDKVREEIKKRYDEEMKKLCDCGLIRKEKNGRNRKIRKSKS